MVCVLTPFTYPRGVGFNPVLPRDGPDHRVSMALRRRKSWSRAPVHQTQHHHPRTRMGGAAPPGGRRRASRRLYSVRTPRGWLGPARGEFLAPNSPLGPPPVLPADFWATGRARETLDFVRWVVSIKARAWSLYIVLGHTLRRRCPGGGWLRNGDFWKCV
jgi:hypothetical protein